MYVGSEHSRLDETVDLDQPHTRRRRVGVPWQPGNHGTLRTHAVMRNGTIPKTETIDTSVVNGASPPGLTWIGTLEGVCYLLLIGEGSLLVIAYRGRAVRPEGPMGWAAPAAAVVLQYVYYDQ